MTVERRLRVALLHPDLGLGGAERLIVDAALELQTRGHRVTIFTGSHDPARAFVETCDGSLDVRVRGAWLPLAVAGRARAPMAVAKSAAAAIPIVMGPRPDVVLCDVVPHVIPLLRARRLPVAFYCHFPDRLLTPPRSGLYRWYRVPIDALESAGTRMASAVLVNSRFTADVFARAYPNVGVTPGVVYPGVDVDRWTPAAAAPGGRTTIVSVARFERSKNAQLAIAAFARLRARISPAAFAPLRLALAGGFDARLPECVETLASLENQARACGLLDRVDLLPSCPEPELRSLVAGALVSVHTAEQEHFGYAPLEAMASGRPVVAAAGGGPLETVVDGTTGFLIPPEPDAFATAIARLVGDPALAERLGAAGRTRAVSLFSRAAFGDSLESALLDMVAPA